jgi:hypothetical protein
MTVCCNGWASSTAEKGKKFMQTIQSSSRFCRYAHFFSMAIAGLAVLAGGTALFGWMLGLGRLIRLGLSADAPIFAVAADAAVAMLLAGLVLLLHQDAASGRLRRRTASACALGVVVFGGLAATDILFSAGFGLGGLFATDAFGETASMSLGEALALVLLGSALWLRDWSIRGFRPGDWLAIAASLVALSLLLAFCGGAQWHGTADALVIRTPISGSLLVLLGLAVPLARPGRGPAMLLASLFMARRVSPADPGKKT